MEEMNRHHEQASGEDTGFQTPSEDTSGAQWLRPGAANPVASTMLWFSSSWR
jgi:hypothetical protein